MQQNEAAYQQHKKTGERLFNEAAFWQGKSLYRGEIDGQPFASVAKSFQVKTWRQIKKSWEQLGPENKVELSKQFEGFQIWP